MKWRPNTLPKLPKMETPHAPITPAQEAALTALLPGLPRGRRDELRRLIPCLTQGEAARTIERLQARAAADATTLADYRAQWAEREAAYARQAA